LLAAGIEGQPDGRRVFTLIAADPSMRREPGADDRRGCVLVDAVGLADLDVLEARGHELALELCLAQGAGRDGAADSR
jgi:hypothetical protein